MSGFNASSPALTSHNAALGLNLQLPTVIIESGFGGACVGLQPAEVRHSPFAASQQVSHLIVAPDGQPIAGDGVSAYADGFIIPDSSMLHGDPRENLVRAKQLLATDPRKAGELAQKARIVFDDAREWRFEIREERDPVAESDLYRLAVQLEALYCEEITPDTLAALDRLPRELRLATAVAHYRANSLDAALHTLVGLTQAGAAGDVVTMMALMTQANIYTSKAMMAQTDVERTSALQQIPRILNDELPAAIDAMGDAAEVRGKLAELYFHNAGFLRSCGFYEEAIAVARTLCSERFSGAGAVEDVLDAEKSPVAPWLKGGRIMTDEEIRSQQGRWKHAIGEGLKRAKFRNSATYWKTALLAGIGSLIAAYVANRFNIDYEMAAAVFGVGASAGVGVAKIHRVLTSPEVRRAYRTGHSDVSAFSALGYGAAEAAKLAATFGLFYALGIPIAGSAAYALNQGSELVNLGPEKWWEQFIKTPFGATVASAHQFFEKLLFQHIPTVPGKVAGGFRDVFSGNVRPMHAAAVFEAASLVYAVGTLPILNTRGKLLERYPRLMKYGEPVALAGNYAIAVHMGLGLGMAPRDALMAPGIGIALWQGVLHLFGGGRLNNFDHSNAARLGLLVVGFNAVGARIVDGADAIMGLPKGVEKDIGFLFGQTMGLMVGFLPLRLAMSGLMGYSQTGRFWPNTLHRTYTAELICLPAVLWGMDKAPVIAFKEGAMMLAAVPAMEEQYQSEAGSRPQKLKFLSDITPPAVNKTRNWEPADWEEAVDGAAGRLENAASQAGERGGMWGMFTGRTLVHRLWPLFVLVNNLRKKPKPFAVGAEPVYWTQTILPVLMDAKTKPEQIDWYLKQLKRIIWKGEPTRWHVHHNMLVTTWAARAGYHGDAIRKFFASMPATLLRHYGIALDGDALKPVEQPLSSRGRKGRKMLKAASKEVKVSLWGSANLARYQAL